jgi:two-component system sensor histidine kinase/response regulator
MNRIDLSERESRRLAILDELGVLTIESDPVLDGLVRCAARLVNTPIALVTLIDASNQWNKARAGTEALLVPRDHAFCNHALQGETFLEVRDATRDPRFQANPLVLGPPHIRFYAGVPLMVDGVTLGSLCAIDSRPHALTSEQRASLEDLARASVARLQEIRSQRRCERILKELQEHKQHLEDLVARRTYALERARQVAEAASSAKSSFLATMSHEIRTPMNGVLGMAELLQRTTLDKDQAEIASTIRESASSLVGLLDDVLDFSRIEAGQLRIEEAPVDIRRLVHGVCDGLGLAASGRKVRVSCVISDDTPNWVQTDGARLRQVLNNLVGNAIKFSGGQPHWGRVVVRVESPRPNRLRIQVVDNGIGMTADVMARIFRPFVQADESTTRRYGGTGLGLSISQKLMKLLGGEISVHSAQGQGATFTLSLPARQVEMPDAADSNLSALSPLTSEKVSSLRVLVAEDNPINQKVIGKQLALLGVEMDLADNGVDALECWRAARGRGGYSLLFTDLHMPEMDGFTLTQQVRAEEAEGEHMPIIALSANAAQEGIHRCLRAGMDDYLTKPVQLRQLNRILQHWTGQGSQDAEQLATSAPSASNPNGLHCNDQVPDIDLSVLAEMFEDDMSLVTDFRQRFIPLTQADLDLIDQAAQDGAWARVRDLAHRIKSSCRLVGAKHMSSLCEDIETSRADSDQAQIMDLVQRLRRQGESVFRLLSKLDARPADPLQPGTTT